MSERIEERSDTEKIEDINKEIEEYESKWKGYIEYDRINMSLNEEDSRRITLKILKLMAERQKIIILQNDILVQQNKELREFLQRVLDDRK